ncbi:beta-ribofuranosylaminobenzene 5'-phosphate synthase family protein [Aromatoleum toluclasticum]|uniref:beta-ribofuranosylaminobenzene 5'-phosphate synthase family protein n=1 Tax=Aromatoleum toluclasticum TaxID=92003 RepID=UPI0012F71602|nr:beta-ribofuranosylaminobenzene 5'-phosphate synthase family protein [Aromatoleum toluclasticum]
MAINNISITVYPRLHLSLLDLSENGYRRNGGVGFAIDTPLSTLRFEASPVTDLGVLRQVAFSEEEVDKLADRIDRIRAEHGLASTIRLKSVTPFSRHSGLGSGTAICLSCVESMFLINGQNAERYQLQELSGRGGVSGIGLNVYFDGGLVCDLGRSTKSAPFIPSDAIDSPSELPLPLVALPMPSWDIGILIPRNIDPLTLEQEIDLFSRTCPLPAKSVYEMVYHTFFGVVASVIEHSKVQFASAVCALQDCKWKAVEIRCYGAPMLSYITTLKQLGCDAVGMSSVGPALFFLAEDFDRTFSSIASEFPSDLLIRTRPRNRGRDLSFD